MITMTDNAANQIKTLMQKAPEGAQGVRLAIKTTGCSGNSYKMDYIKAGEDLSADDCIECCGAALYIPKMHSWMMIGMTIDHVTDELGNSRFEFINPNETGRCGCGESFQVEKQDQKV